MPALIPLFDNEANPWINTLLREKALRCPECGASQSKLNVLNEDHLIKPRYVVACSECKHHGEFGRDVIDAIKKWNKGKPWNLQDALRKKVKRWKRYWR